MPKLTFKVQEDDSGKRLDVFCFQRVNDSFPGVSRSYAQELIKGGKVLVDGKTLKPHNKLKCGSSVEIDYQEKSPAAMEAENISLDIIHEDKDIIVINKPSGIVVHPAPGNHEHTVVNALLFRFPGQLSSVNPKRPGIVHRLDKDTSGVMIAAKNNASHLSLAGQFADHTVKKTYIAVVEGSVEFDNGVIDLPLARDKNNFRRMSAGFSDDMKEAKTVYRTIKRTPDFSVLEVSPETGRTHQIRVHMASLGNPVLGDNMYGRSRACRRLMLHAQKISFIHPRTNKLVEFEAALPDEFMSFVNLSSLKKGKRT